MRQFKAILVTGGCGFIGSAFIRLLLKNDYQGTIVNVDRLGAGSNPANVKIAEADPRYHFYALDICQREAIENLCKTHSIDAIVHFAAESHVDRSIHGPDAFIKSNIQGTFELLEIVRKNPHIHFHHISTDEVYGALGPTGYFSEKSSYQPSSPYSASKAASDHLVRAWLHTYDLKITLSNCSNNYGPYQHPEKLIPHMIHSSLLGLELPIYGNGKNVRDWIYVDDHVEAIWLILQKAKIGSTYNVGSRCEKDNLSLVSSLTLSLAQELNLELDTFSKRMTFVEDRKGHDARYAIDPSLIEEELHWKPRYNLEQGLKETVRWYLTNQEWLLAHKAVGVQTRQ